jgi:hypothetical protein
MESGLTQSQVDQALQMVHVRKRVLSSGFD